jgi:3-hydroxyisobutyrate dehydrogenase
MAPPAGGDARTGGDSCPTVGFIGLGRMGRAMATRLSAAGVRLVVWNRTKTKAVGLRADIAESPAALASRVAIAFVSLSDSDAVESVLTQPEGMLAADLTGTLIIDTSTNHFSRVVAFHAMLAERGAAYVEAPVLGSVTPAARGTLTVLVSGTPAAYAQAQPYLQVIAERIFFLEQAGLATKLKLINNLVLGSLMCSLAEALVFGETVGVDKATVLAVLAAGAGASTLLSAKRDKLLAEDFAGDFTAELMDKDLTYLKGLAAAVQRPLLTDAAARELFARTVEQGLAKEDFSVVYETLKRG